MFIFYFRLANDRQDHTQPEGKKKRLNKDRFLTLFKNLPIDVQIHTPGLVETLSDASTAHVRTP